MKHAIFILSDPKAGDDAVGRLFNGLALAAEAKAAGDDVAIVFSGAGTRWPEELARFDHPARELYESVRDSVRGASCGCAEVFGASAGLESCGLPLLKQYELAGTPGLASMRAFAAEGYQTLVF